MSFPRSTQAVVTQSESKLAPDGPLATEFACGQFFVVRVESGEPQCFAFTFWEASRFGVLTASLRPISGVLAKPACL